MKNCATFDLTREQLIAELDVLRAEAQVLRERNALLMSVIDGNNDLVFAKDERGCYVLINQACANFHGKLVAEIVGHNDTELFEPDTARRFIEDDREIIVEGLPKIFEESVTLSGVTRNFLVTKVPYSAGEGRHAGVIGISRDITDRKRAEESLRETQEFLARLLDHTPSTIYVATADGRLRMVNRAWEEIMGRRRDEVLGLPIERIFRPELARRFLDQNRQIIETVAPIAMEEEFEVAAGRRVFYTVKFPLRDGSGHVEAIGGISFDITDWKRAEKSLGENRLRLQALFENTMDAIWLLDDEGQFIDANPAACSLLGYSREEYSSMRLGDVSPDGTRDLIDGMLKKFVDEGRLAGEFTQLHKDGTTREVEFQAVAKILPGVHMSVNRDISVRKRAEQGLRKSEEQVRLLLNSTGEAIYGVDPRPARITVRPGQSGATDLPSISLFGS